MWPLELCAGSATVCRPKALRGEQFNQIYLNFSCRICFAFSSESMSRVGCCNLQICPQFLLSSPESDAGGDTRDNEAIARRARHPEREATDDIVGLVSLTYHPTTSIIVGTRCANNQEDGDSTSETPPAERSHENAAEAFQIALPDAVEA